MSSHANYRFCRALVRAHDRDRYLAGLLAPRDKRPQLFALFAFNYEVARVRDAVREPMAGEVRLQWWRDAVSGSARGDVLRNPVAAALLTAIEAGSLPRAQFLELIDAHTFDLYDDPMPDQGQLDAYCDSTAGALFHLAIMLLSGSETPKLSRLLQHAGRAYAVTGLLRAFALHASRGQLYFPVDVLRRHGVDHNAIMMGQGTPALSSALAEFCLLARRHHEWVSRSLPSASPAVRAALLPLALVPLYLDRMERAGYDPFKTAVEVAQWRRQWRLWRAARSLG